MDFADTVNGILNLFTALAIAYSVRTTKQLLVDVESHRDKVEPDR